MASRRRLVVWWHEVKEKVVASSLRSRLEPARAGQEKKRKGSAGEETDKGPPKPTLFVAV